jgi:malonyl CoA-acyl carrier protein transacylase
MASAGGDDAGSMLAVALPIHELERFVEENCPHLVIANRNAPQQAVLSGQDAAISDAIRILEQRGVRHRKLPVSAAFHSEEVASAAVPFEEVLQRARFHPTSAAVFANSTAREYPEAESDAKSLLAHQIARPVQFLEMIQEMVQRGATTFLEVGPGQVLTGLIRSILEDCSEGATAISIDSGKLDLTDLAAAVGRLAVEGHPVDLCSWDPHGRSIEDDEDGMVVMIRGANLRPGEASARPETSVVRPPTTDTSSTPQVTKTPPIATTPVAEPVATGSRSDAGSVPTMTVIESQESLMKAIEDALSMQQKLAEAQRNAEQVLESSLIDTTVTARPSAPLPPSEPTRPIPEVKQELPATAEDGLMTAILEIVADKTGYPTSAIGTDLDLESDLGIDSIKRVEILSALRIERPELEAIPAEMLGTLRTIDAIVNWYREKTIEQQPTRSNSEVDPVTALRDGSLPTDIGDATLRLLICEVVADKTGYPVEAIGSDLDLEADLGIDSIKRVEILSAMRKSRPELPAIPPELLGTLRSIDSIVSWYSDVIPNSEIDTEIAPEPPRQQPISTEEDGVESIIVSVISEKTGYPADAIGTDLDLEADLGIDSIKRVEILSAIRERRPQLPAIPPELLGTLRSIDSIVGWYLENSSSVATPAVQQETVTVAASKAAGPSRISADSAGEVTNFTYLDAIPVALPVARRGASPMATASQQRPFHVVCDQPQLARALVTLLQSRGVSALSSPLCCPEDPQQVIGSETPGGLLLLLDSPADPDEAIRMAFRWLRAAGRCFQDADDSQGALVALVQRFDGRFGLEPVEAMVDSTDPAFAALSGMAKCAAREWPSVQVRSIDLSLAFDDPSQAAQQLVDELIEGDGMEIGLAPAGRIEVQLQLSPEDEQQGELVREGGLVIVTGGARGVTAACVEAVARRYQPNFLLLGRTAAPGDEPDWALGVADDQLEPRCFELQGQKDSPATIRASATEILRMREMARLFETLRDLGCRIEYRSIDVRDGVALEHCIDEVRAKYGPVRGIIHGAGVLADRWITEKTDEQFDLVWSTKVDSARHLLSICREEELDFIAFFSSTTARLGRKGQSDYAAANEVLNRMAIIEASRRPSCRVRSIGWGPWDGGMVHPGLRSVFHDEGIDLIPLREGARVFIEKMQSDGPPQCVILAPRGSVQQTLRTIGRFPAVVTPATVAPIADVEPRKMETGQTLSISTERMPVLLDHRLDGRAVVPAALLLEWCLWAASHRHPGLELHGVDDFRVLKGVVLDADEECQVTFQTGSPTPDGALLRVPVEIRSGETTGRVHARAEVLLGDRLTTRSSLQAPTYSEDSAPNYPALLFHGPRFQCIQQVARISSMHLAVLSVGAPSPREWLEAPMRSDWLIDPLRIDAVFQALILWSRSQRGMPSLPCGIARLRCHLPIDSGVLETRISIESSKGATASARVEILNRSGLPAVTIEGAEMVIDAALENAFGCDQQAKEATP